MVGINFGMLCALILSTYLFESVVHMVAIGQSPIVFFNLFVLSFAIVYALLRIVVHRRACAPAGRAREFAVPLR